MMQRNTVLVVDDQPLMLSLVQAILETTPYEVHTCQTAQEALVFVEHHAQQMGLLISDVRLGNSNGPDLARAVISRCPDTAVLLMSGASVEDSNLDIEFPHSFVSKPFKPAQLLACVYTLLPIS